MSVFVWILIPLVVIIGGYIIDYQKNKLKWQSQNSQTDNEIEEIRKLMFQMKKRLENLEAIAAGEPDNFSNTNKNPHDIIEVPDSNEIKNENKRTVENLAKNRGK